MSNSLNRLQQEAFGAIVDNSVIAKRLGGSLPKFAGLMAIALAMSSMSHDAHADRRTGQKIAAVLTAGAGIGYMAGNTDGAKALGAGAMGALAGSQIGKGNGATAGAIVGGVLGYAYVNGAQNERDRLAQERLWQQQQYQQQMNGGGYVQPVVGYNNYNNNYNNGYNNRQYNNNYQQPQRMAPAPRMPRDLVLYEVTGQRSFYVTIENSMSMQQFRGTNNASRALDSDRQVSNQINISYHNYVTSYNELQKAYSRYENMVYENQIDNDKIRRQMYYSQDPNGSVAVNAQQQNARVRQLQMVTQDFQRAAETYGVNRGTFFTNADNAVFEGFDVTPYAQAMSYVKPPEQISVALNGNNKFPRVRDERVAFTLR